MKCKQFLALGLAALLCVTPFTVANTGDAKAKKPKLAKTKLTLTKGKKTTLKVKNIKGKKTKVTWSTSDYQIVKLSKKKKTSVCLNAMRKGSATIKCKVVKSKKEKYTLKCKVRVKAPVVTDLPSMKDTYQNIVPNMGTCLNYGNPYNKRELQTAKTMDFVKKHYNSFTLENEMKPDNILGSSANLLTIADAQAKGYFIPEGYSEEKVPELNFEEVDGAMKVANDNGLRMRAHTLVWHSQTPAWFFDTGYKNGKAVTKEIMDKRLEFYVHNVMAHVMNKEKELNGTAGSIVYAWDVVNEYLHRSSFGHTWTTVYGQTAIPEYPGIGNPCYVKKAFEIAYAMLAEYNVTDKVTLFSNDYNTYFEQDKELKLIEYINAGEPAKICGGIGMQAHVDVDVPTVELFGQTLEKFLASGLEVQITELDVTINYDTKNGTYRYSDEKETDAKQAKYIKNLMTTIIKKNNNRDKTINPKGLTGITFWGLYDSVSWRSTCNPLLFDTSITDPKASFYEFIKAAQGQ